MHSSHADERGDRTALLTDVAQRLCGAPVAELVLCRGSGNNRVYRVRTAVRSFALKWYPAAEVDDRDRLGHEYDGLRFLAGAHVGAAVPAALAVDRESRCALYEWIDGVAPTARRPGDIAAALELLAALHRARAAAGAADVPAATEAVLRKSDLAAQLERRLERFSALGAAEPELMQFLDEVRSEISRRLATDDGAATDALPPRLRTLSPSDFGFHNTLRDARGRLTFIDFEYFGWDDPVKVTADFLWHPAMRLEPDERAEFLRGAGRIYGDDPSFAARLAADYPLYGLRWALIVLNEFLPQLWQRRSIAGKGGDWDVAKRQQLHIARCKLDAVRSYQKGSLIV